MTVIHILKNGSVKKDIAGHVVQREDAETLYQVLDRINSKKPVKNHKEVKR